MMKAISADVATIGLRNAQQIIENPRAYSTSDVLAACRDAIRLSVYLGTSAQNGRDLSADTPQSDRQVPVDGTGKPAQNLENR